MAPSTARTQPEDASELLDDEGLDDLHETIMAIDMRERGTVGCAYYVAQTEKLHLMEDVRLGSAEVVDMRKSKPARLFHAC